MPFCLISKVTIQSFTPLRVVEYYVTEGEQFRY